MCAKDRSHIAVRSQTDSIHSMREMLNISSCPAFIRDSRGEVILDCAQQYDYDPLHT